MSDPARAVGLDFGTTNSAIGVSEDDGRGRRVTLARFPSSLSPTSETFRSILFFHPEARDARGRLEAVGGSRAIERYLAADGTGRLIQSLKSYLADRSFQATNVFQRTMSLGDLVTLLLADLRARAEEALGPLGPRVVVGRPVHFASAGSADDEALAVERLTASLAEVGWTDVTFEYEPVAAAYFYESQLDHDELVLIADFGGGTSDFSLVDVGPSHKKGGTRTIRGSDGVGLAGDALDAKLLQHVVAPELGLGTRYKSMFGRELEVPVWIYHRLRRWHHLSFLKSKKNLDLLSEIADQTSDPARIEALMHVLDHDLGYHLNRAVERAKVELSSKDATTFTFADPPVRIEAPIARAAFEGWIAEEIGAMAACVDGLLARASVQARDVDQVFMTGGTSFVPAVRGIFDERFGAAKIRAGGEMISVATGLALRAMTTCSESK
jgi:hypothetical chaperone protein